MPHIITEACVSEVYASCVAVCPVDCIHFVDKIPEGMPRAGQSFMVIDTGTCIDCAACLTECPIGAVENDITKNPAWTVINEKLAPIFAGKKPPPRDKNEQPRRPENKRINP